MVNEYWKKRIKAEQLAKTERDASLGDEFNRLYNYHYKEIEKEIQAFYNRYADKNGLSIEEVRKQVDIMDVKAFEEKAKRYVAEKNFSQEANRELGIYNLKMKVNRLELLQRQLDLELIALGNDEQKQTKDFITEDYINEIKTQAGLLGRSVLTEKEIRQTVKTLLNTPFKGATWSDNIWERQNVLRQVVAKITEEYLLKGKNPTTFISQLKKEFDVSSSQAKRLAVTEGARVATEAQKQSFTANGYDEYEYIAEAGACPQCAALSGKIFKVKNMMPGENAAPMHPHCRCSTAAHYSKSQEEYEAMLDKSRETPLGVPIKWEE